MKGSAKLFSNSRADRLIHLLTKPPAKPCTHTALIVEVVFMHAKAEL